MERSSESTRTPAAIVCTLAGNGDRTRRSARDGDAEDISDTAVRSEDQPAGGDDAGPGARRSRRRRAAENGSGGDEGRQHAVPIPIRSGNGTEQRAESGSERSVAPAAREGSADRDRTADSGGASGGAGRLEEKKSAAQLKQEEKQKTLATAKGLLDDIFGAYRKAQRRDDGKPFKVLGDKLAENAGQLICFELTGMKELTELLIKLDGADRERSGGEGKTPEQALKDFLRGPDHGGSSTDSES